MAPRQVYVKSRNALKVFSRPVWDCRKVLAKGASLADYDWPTEASQSTSQTIQPRQEGSLFCST